VGHDHALSYCERKRDDPRRGSLQICRRLMILVFRDRQKRLFSIPERVNSECVEKAAGYTGRIGRPSAKKAQMSQTAAEAIAIAPP